MRPSYATPLSEVVTTGLDPVIHAEATRRVPVEARRKLRCRMEGKRRTGKTKEKSEAQSSALFLKLDSRVSGNPGNDGQRERDSISPPARARNAWWGGVKGGGLC
jgi:hypothetical protein